MTIDPNENVNPAPENEEIPVEEAPKKETPAEEAPAEANSSEANSSEANSSEANSSEDLPAAETGDNESQEDFAAMLEAHTAQSDGAEVSDVKIGAEVKGKIVQIGDHEAFVDCGFRNELPISVEELKDPEGKVLVSVGDEITAHVQKGNDGPKLTLAINLRHAGHDALVQAHESGTPIEGKVGETNKGGFSIDLGGMRAFCPFSQIDVRRADDPTVFVGNTYKFKVLEISEDMRNIVVSRRALLQASRDEQATETRQTLELGMALEGEVTRLVPFGAFVDIGGVEGLVHISQISFQRVGDPSDVLKEGQMVKVKVMEIQNLGQGRSERISLSIKALASDPWPSTAESLAPGTDVEGKVTRLVDFGVFVELLPGIEGLIHISELANRRIIHPREVLNEDETISVRVLDVDLDRRRISLSRRQASDYDGD